MKENFHIRGVVEGFYGTPWSHEDRLSMLEFLGRHNMNTYIYAPKDDPKHRDIWRELYTDKEKEQIRELVCCAGDNKVNFTYAISPGLDFDYTDYEKDKAKLIEKCDSVYDLGVRNFALLLDDLAERTAETAGNHVRLVNDLRKEFFAKHTDLSELICIFAEYYDTIVTDDYTGTIAAGLNSDVIVMWTGPSIALQMSAESFEKPDNLYQRKILLWWNYPVNDYCKDNLLADGVKGLSVDLRDGVIGIVSNPMNQAEASKLPLSTLADYMENSAGYVYEKSYEKALNELYPGTAESVRMLFENLYASGINNRTDSIHFKKLLASFENKEENSVSELYDEFLKLKTAVTDINENCCNRSFVEEITHWLDKALHTANMGIYFINAIDARNENAFWENFRLYNSEKLVYDDITAVFSGRVLTPFFAGKAKKMLEEAGPVLQNLSGNITITKSKAIAAASLECCQDNVISNVTDDNEKTFYWSESAASEGFWIMLDLGYLQKVNNIVLKSGCEPSGLDYIRKGHMQFSSDCSEWHDIGVVQTKRVVSLSGLDIECRYVRYISLSKQDYWMSASEFAVNVRAESSFVCGSPFGEYGREAFRMTDGDMFSFYKSERKPAPGERMVFNTAGMDFKEIVIMQSSLCKAEVIIKTVDNEISIGILDEYYKHIPILGGTRVEKVILEWRGEVIPVINNVLFR